VPLTTGDATMQRNVHKNPKPPKSYSLYRPVRTAAPLACRRCGAHCDCTEDEIDAGGPA